VNGSSSPLSSSERPSAVLRSPSFAAFDDSGADLVSDKDGAEFDLNFEAQTRDGSKPHFRRKLEVYRRQFSH
jgi:hypothetical protein